MTDALNLEPIEELLDAMRCDDASKEKMREDLVKSIAANTSRLLAGSLAEEDKDEFAKKAEDPVTLFEFLQTHVSLDAFLAATQEATAEVMGKFIANLDMRLAHAG